MKTGRLMVVPAVGVCLGAILALAQTRPVTMPATAAAHTDDEYLAHVARISRDLPTFTVLVQKPFVIAGDDAPEAVRAAGVQTVKWTVEHLKKDFFEKDPVDLIDIYLFKNKASYDKYTKDYFKDPVISPYGYYSPNHKALIMNIGTGTGTLVHEIVHPFMAANFPSCPTWFNEGLASLYEQSMEKDGHIWGLPNWRLTDLKQNFAGTAPAGEGKPPSFKALCAMDSGTFYGAGKSPNYGIARYLCLYLQEKGVLAQFYKDFVRNQKADPTGYDTLQKTLAGLGEKDMEAFRKKWEAWVMGLKYP
jgi:hypothetical protein